jgi:hypothetical protein
MSNISSISSLPNPSLLSTSNQLSTSTSSTNNKPTGQVDSDSDQDATVIATLNTTNGSLNVTA